MKNQLPSYKDIKPPDESGLVVSDAAVRAHLGDKDGDKKIVAFATNHFDAQQGGKVDILQRDLVFHEKQLKAGEGQLEGKQKELNATTEYFDRHEDEVKTPWNLFEIVKFWLLAAVSVVLLMISGGTIKTNLLATGEPIFLQEPYLVYLFASIPLMFAFLVKNFCQQLERQTTQRRYTRWLYILGSLFGIIWFAIFAYLYNGLNQDVEDVIASITSDTKNQYQSILEWLFLSAQLLGETVMAGAFWITMQRIYDDHHQIPRSKSPHYKQLSQDCERLEKSVVQRQGIVQDITTRLEQFANIRKTYIEAYAHEFALRKAAMSNFESSFSHKPTKPTLRMVPKS